MFLHVPQPIRDLLALAHPSSEMLGAGRNPSKPQVARSSACCGDEGPVHWVGERLNPREPAFTVHQSCPFFLEERPV